MKKILSMMLALVLVLALFAPITANAATLAAENGNFASSDYKSSADLTKEWFGVTDGTNIINEAPSHENTLISLVDISLYSVEEIRNEEVEALISQYADMRQQDFCLIGAKTDYSSLYSNDELLAVQQSRPDAIVQMQERFEQQIVNAVVTCKIQSIDWQNDAAFVNMYEWTFYDYDDLSDDKYILDVTGFGTDHIIHFQKISGNLKIVDDLYDESDITGIATQISPESESTFQEDTIPSDSSTTASTEISATATYIFSGELAAEYADRWALVYNPAFKNYNDSGGDCVNYVSQCLDYGGMTRTSTWTPYKAAWISVSSFSPYFQNIGTYRSSGATNSQFNKGDVIITNNNGHVMICTGKNSAGTAYFNGHNYDRFHSVMNNGGGNPAIMFTSSIGEPISGNYSIKNVSTGLYLTVQGDGMDNRTNILGSTFTGATGQRYAISSASRGTVMKPDCAPSSAVNINRDGTPVNNDDVFIWGYKSDDRCMHWVFEKVGNDYVIRSAGDLNVVLTMDTTSKDVRVKTYDGEANQKWRLEQPIYEISLSQTGTYTFPPATAGYGAQTAKSVTITNTGGMATGTLKIELSGGGTSSFTLSKTTQASLSAGATGSFTVVPITGLAVRTHTAIVTVSSANNTNIEPRNFNVSFTVGAPEPDTLTGTVTISNTSPRIGDVLTGSLVGGNNTGTLSYQWKANGTNVGTNSDTYTVIEADFGKTITLEIRSSVEVGAVNSTPTTAVDKADDPADPDAPMIVVSSVTGVAGANVEVKIIADNMPLLAALEFKLIYPESVMTLIRAGLTDNSGFNIIFPVEYPSGTLFTCTPLGTDVIDSNGVLVNLTFAISSEAALGVYPITFSESYAGDEDGNAITFISKSGEITVANPVQYGHFTGRDRVDGTDVLWINRYIASGRDLSVMLENFPTTITTFHEAAAYFTNRSRVDGTDVLWINRYIASGRNVDIMLQTFPTTIDFSHLGTINTALIQAKSLLIPNVSIALASDASSMVTLTPSSTVVTKGNTFTVAIDLDCEPGENIAAFEFFLNFDPTVLRLETPYEYPGVLQAADVIGTFFALTPRASTPHTGSGNIMVLTFTVLDDSKPAIVGINIDYAGDIDGNESVVSNPDSVTINPQMTDAQAVALDKASMTWESIRGENITQNAVTANLAELPTTGANGTEITWDSTNSAVTNQGAVTRPIFSEGDAMGTLKATITKGNDSDSVDFVLTVLKLPDTSPPVGSITIETHSWNSFWDMLPFGLFCKNTQAVTITGEDDSGEPVDIQYYLSTDELTLNQIEAITDWTDYTNPFNIVPNNKYIIYAKLTDSSDNVAYINSDGIVLYTDSVQDTVSISFTKGSGLDQTTNVTLNGNTINGIMNGSLTLESADDYTVFGETITFKADYLDSLAVGDYTLTVYYNPLGMEYPSDPLSGSQSPATTTIALKINNLVNAEPPSIIVHPQGAVYTQNATAAPLTVTAASTDGGTLSYQWYSATSSSAEGTPIGINSNTYTPSTTTVETLYYYVVVTNTNTNVNGNTSATTTSDLAVITVNELPEQVVSFDTANPAPITFGQTGYANLAIVTTPAAGGGTITYSSSDTDVISVNSDTGVLTTVGVGTATITATAAAIPGYKAGTATYSISVNPKTVVITPDSNLAKVYGEDDPELGYIHDAAPLAPVFTGALARTEGENVGSYAINIGTLDAGSNYSLTLNDANIFYFDITKAVHNPISYETPVLYNDTAQQVVDVAALVSAYKSDADILSFSIGAIADDDGILYGTPKAFISSSTGELNFTLIGELSPADVDKTAVIPVVVGNFNNYVDTTVNVTVRVIDKEITTVSVTAPANVIYGQTIGDPNAEAAAGGSTFTYSYSGTLYDIGNSLYGPTDAKPTQPGTYTVTATLDSATHNGTSNPSAQFTIARKTLTWASAGTANGKIYDGNVDATQNSAPILGDIETGDVVAVTEGALAFSSKDAGVRAVTATGYGIVGADSWKYYAPVAQPSFGNAVIERKELTIQGASHTKVYDNTTAATGVTVTLADFVAGDTGITPNVVTAAYTSANAGTTTINITSVTLQGAGTDNYTVTPRNGISVEGITKKPLTADMISSIADHTYTGAAITPTPAVTDAAALIQASDYTWSYSNNIKAGQATAIITATAGGNYSGSASTTFNITLNYAVTFDLAGGTRTGGGELVQTIPQGGAATAPIATRDGYTFVGWDKAFDNVTSDMTVTAQWSVNTYTVSFDLAGGARTGGGTLVQTVPQSGAATAPIATRNGYTFVGWDKTFDNVTSDITVTAQWSVISYTVKFDSGGGTPVADAQVEYQSKVAQPVDPTKDEYTFIGWFNGDVLYDFNTPVTGDLMLIAVWKLTSDFILVTSIKIDAPAQVTVLRSSKYTFGLTLNLGATSEGVVWSVSPVGFAVVDPITGEVFTQNKTGTVVLTATDTASGLSSNIILRII
ncbi:MAG: InlB B-repeat-containing protein [Oscillospiraceae bacterium]|nr:InlB B-repeat-containing protein [Oscillospiraceae bacterium]